MNVKELNRDQLKELKERYLVELADEGKFAKVMGCDYHEPSWGDMAQADSLVSDETIFERYSGTDFTDDDFSCSRATDEGLFDPKIDGVQYYTYHRKPTPAEIKFGEGAIHYRNFPECLVRTIGFKVKRWIKAADDGLRYYR